ncbi:FKBP-type peptidyl-prolyl cis-trans isomerase [Raoultibacter massiliensis]|uniref:FKBP-type peptidyl-prolyl cis-trans isomerase n=1 Tax=Raoultibacter massiliensis TaxID=1852371 RepID=UPI000C828764|nr:FKBP-type peptidyl-prolyl cis-trans isomerase [Raoultibacter massiliensis]
MVREGQRIRFLYKGSLPDGTVFDDCLGIPHEIVIGRHQVMRALEATLSEMEPGEERTLELPCSEAYGEYNESAVQKVPTYKIPNGDNLPVGETIGWTSPRNIEPIPVKVVSIENQVATLDFNHPLAGKDIAYWIKLVEVSDGANT